VLNVINNFFAFQELVFYEKLYRFTASLLPGRLVSDRPLRGRPEPQPNQQGKGSPLDDDSLMKKYVS